MSGAMRSACWIVDVSGATLTMSFAVDQTRYLFLAFACWSMAAARSCPSPPMMPFPASPPFVPEPGDNPVAPFRG
jgi:hypothetical protein